VIELEQALTGALAAGRADRRAERAIDDPEHASTGRSAPAPERALRSAD
jgi:hypothetical protein